MQKLLFLFMIVPVLMCSQAGVLPNLFQGAQMVKVYNNGQEIVMSEQTKEEFDKIFIEAVEDSRQMPAFGVSIHKLTVEEMKSGIWVKFIYDKTMQANNMPFDELLIRVEKDMHGFNVIRGNDGIYNGRCFYLELENDFNAVYDFLSNLEASENESEVEVELDIQEEKEVQIVSSGENKDDENDDDNKINDKTEPKDNEEEKKDSAQVLVEQVSQFDEQHDKALEKTNENSVKEENDD